MKLIRSIIFVTWFYGTMGAIGIGMWPFVVADDRHVWTALRMWGRTTLWGLRWIIGARVKFEGLEHVPQGGALIVRIRTDNLIQRIFSVNTAESPLLRIRTDRSFFCLASKNFAPKPIFHARPPKK